MELLVCIYTVNSEIFAIILFSRIALKDMYIVKPVLGGHSKIDKTKILMQNGSLMKVESILQNAGAFCNTFDLH